LRDDTGAAEEQRQGQTDHEWRRDNRQDGQQSQSLLEGKARAGGDECKAQTEKRRAAGRHDRQEKRAPGNATAIATRQAA
jgi:hypothetical protein